MPIQHAIWKVGAAPEARRNIELRTNNIEHRIEENGWMLIGRQVRTSFGGIIDLLMALVDHLETQLAASRATAKNLLEALVTELTTGGAHFPRHPVEAERVRKTSLRTRAVK